MSNHLEVHPDSLFAASAGLASVHGAVGTGIVGVSGTLAAAPAGVDDISLFASAAFGAFSANLVGVIASGLSKGFVGASELTSIGLNFQTMDIRDGVTMQSAGSRI